MNKVDQLYEHLSARERALLAIRHIQDETDEPRALRQSIPESQIPEFNRYLGLARANARILCMITLLLQPEVEALRLRHLVLGVLALWAEDRRHLFGALWLHSRELMTQSEYDRRLKETSAEHLSLDEAVERVILHREIAVEIDEEWEGIERQVAAEIRATGREKVLLTRGRGQSLSVQYASLCAWLGTPVRVHGELALHVEIVPDDETERVERDRESLQASWRQFNRGVQISPGAFRADAEVRREPEWAERTGQAIAERVRDEFANLRGKLTALEAAYHEIATAFGGESVTAVEQQEALDELREGVATLGQELDDLVGPLPEAALDEAFAAQLEEAIRREVDE